MAPSAAPPVYLIQGPNLLQAAIANLPDVIDFGFHGPQITATQFVGVHCLGPGIVAESPRRASRPTGVSNILKGLLGSRRTSQEKDLDSNSDDLRNNNYIPPELLQQQDLSGRLSADGAKLSSANGGSSDRLSNVSHSPPRREEQNGREEFSDSTSPPHANYNVSGVHTWELVWKEGKAGGPLKRLKFVTTDSGYQLIQNRLHTWSSASFTSKAMNEAAKAALDACGGHLKQNPLHAQDSSFDNIVPAKRGVGEAVDHANLQPSNFEQERNAVAAETLEEETYPHGDYVIDMQSTSLQGSVHPHCDSTSSILEDDHTGAIAAVLPVRFRSYNWTLLYSTERDGISLNTLYRKVHMNGPTILVIRDFHKKIFGCYASEEWKVAGRSYGTGESFVFQLVPDMKAYKWTRTNHMFMYSTVDVIAIGGGDHYSILLNSDLLTGYSGACETYGSPPLASSEDFDVSAVEVWGFQEFSKFHMR